MIKLVTKVLPIFEHHAGTANGVSTDKNGRKNDLLGGTGHVNVFSVLACRDVSCIIFRKLEQNRNNHQI